MTTKRQDKPLKAVTRDSSGKLVSGTPNPGGMTAEVRLVRDGMAAWLSSPAMQEKFKAAYTQLLEEANPAITQDAANRYMGKVKDVLEHQGDAPMRLTMLTREEILAIAKGEEVK